jgi:hypothetical protein
LDREFRVNPSALAVAIAATAHRTVTPFALFFSGNTSAFGAFFFFAAFFSAKGRFSQAAW